MRDESHDEFLEWCANFVKEHPYEDKATRA